MLNKAMLIGNVGSDPDIRTMPNGGRVASFSLATSEYWTDKNSGERQSRTEWHKIVVFSEGLIKLIEKAVHKGSKVYVEGQIKSRKYTSQTDGIERTIVEIVLQGFNCSLQVMDPRPKSENGEFDGGQKNENKNDVEMPEDNSDNIDDDIPF